MKILVAYFSHGGNNKFIAEKIAADCRGELLEIQPRLKGMFFVILSTLLKVGFGIRKSKVSVRDFDGVVVCGPIYMGQLASPVTAFLGRNGKNIKRLFLATCCGGGEAEKDSKFGYGAVLENVRASMKEKYVFGDALPIDLIVPDELKDDGEAIMKLRLTEDTFRGKITEKYERFLEKVKSEPEAI